MPQTFTLADSKGGTHTYSIDLFGGSEGMQLAQKITALAIQPIAAALGPAMVAYLSDSRPNDQAAQSALAGVDVTALGMSCSSVLTQLDKATVYKMLSQTNRDGKALVSQDGTPTVDFDLAYQANYLELGKALVEVAMRNGFLPGIDSFSGVIEKAQRLAAEHLSSDAKSESQQSESSGPPPAQA